MKAEALKGEASRLRDLLLSAEPGLSSRPERRPLIPEPDEAELASAEGGRPGAPVMAKLPPTPTPMVSIGTVDVATGVRRNGLGDDSVPGPGGSSDPAARICRVHVIDDRGGPDDTARGAAPVLRLHPNSWRR